MSEIITEDNLGAITEKLKHGEGYLLMVGPGPQSRAKPITDVALHLYHHALIHMTGNVLRMSSPRGTMMVDEGIMQTGWEKDRRYLLRKISSPEDLPHLPIGGFAFLVGMETCVGQTLVLDGKHRAFFTPHVKGDVRKALIAALNFATTIVRDGAALTTEYIEDACKYALLDLQTGTVLDESLRAEMLK